LSNKEDISELMNQKIFLDSSVTFKLKAKNLSNLNDDIIDTKLLAYVKNSIRDFLNFLNTTFVSESIEKSSDIVERN
jgi:hypothetical protein